MLSGAHPRDGNHRLRPALPRQSRLRPPPAD